MPLESGLDERSGPGEPTTKTPADTPLLTVTGAARLLGVHVNTVRAWTDQGRLRCLRINSRGDRRYTPAELDRFLERVGHRQRADAAGERARRSARPSPQEPPIVSVLAALAHASAGRDDLDHVLPEVPRLLAPVGYSGALYVGHDGSSTAFGVTPAPDTELPTAVRRTGQPTIGPRRAGGIRHVGVPITATTGKPDVLLLERRDPGPLPAREELDLLRAVTALLDGVAVADRKRQALEQHARRAQVVRALSSKLTSELDPRQILRELLDTAAELFGADHAGVLRRGANGSFAFEHSYRLSAAYRQALEHAPSLPLTQQAYEQGRIVFATNYPDDPRGAPLRHALLREGINSVLVAPLVSDGELLGALVLYHDRVYEWAPDDVALIEQFAQIGGAALNNARNYNQMATWAAQLQSIQQLGARLTRLNSVREIGQAIAAELNQLIDYHNVRVYRLAAEDVVPVAWRGEVGEYTGEDGEQLRVKVGQGITGWVALHGIAQNLGDAAADRRTETIPGTEDGLDESLLLAPMLYEDEVIGVIVLAKLGLNQFTADDLRLLEIYASIAAQAMANADVTEQLRAQSETLARQVQSQRELMRVTETILGTLDTQDLLGEIAVRLGSLLHVDNISVDVYDRETRVIRPIFARGIHAEHYLGQALPENEGVAGAVLRSGEAMLVEDQLADGRVVHFPGLGRQAGALIVAPLRARDEIHGLLTIERLGDGARFSSEEFELVKLFAGQVSIALQNAEAHHAVELRAATDPLTGLKNHGALNEQLTQAVLRDEPFAVLMIDLDGFKTFNDAHGHEAGNVMLRRLADALRAACRESDEIFRYGGDEFAVILPVTGVTGARQVAAKLRSAVGEVSAVGGRAEVRCSIGVAAYPLHGADRSALLLAADRACYAAKRAGGGRILIAESTDAPLVDSTGTGPSAIGDEPTETAGADLGRQAYSPA